MDKNATDDAIMMLMMQSWWHMNRIGNATTELGMVLDKNATDDAIVIAMTEVGVLVLNMQSWCWWRNHDCITIESVTG